MHSHLNCTDQLITRYRSSLHAGVQLPIKNNEIYKRMNVCSRESVCMCMLGCVISKHVYPVRTNHSDFIVQQRGSARFDSWSDSDFIVLFIGKPGENRKRTSVHGSLCAGRSKRFHDTREMSIARA